MSKLLITPEWLVEQVFERAAPPGLRVTGASFDAGRQCVVLEVEGPGVPEAEEVIAVCHRQPPLRVEFQAR